MKAATGPTLAEIQAARERVHGLARETPVFSSETLGRRSGRPVFLKAENLQRTGSFKIRGAVNKLATMTDEERAAGVVTASAGNHGQAVALAAREAGVAATVFMPLDAPMAKVDATRSYGAEVLLSGEDFDDAQGAAREGPRPARPSSTPSRTRPWLPGRERSASSSPSSLAKSRRSSFPSAAAVSRPVSRSRSASYGPRSTSSACRLRTARRSPASTRAGSRSPTASPSSSRVS